MVQQLTVFIENRSGRLAEMARALGEAGHNMRALMVADTAEFGVARVLCDRPHAAKEVLEAAGFGVTLTDVVAVPIPDEPGGLAGVLEVLAESGVNVEYAYVFVRPHGETAVDIFRFEDLPAGQRALRDAGYEVLPAEALYQQD
jgi:hypothetical protein